MGTNRVVIADGPPLKSLPYFTVTAFSSVDCSRAKHLLVVLMTTEGILSEGH
jgi:hypothetical protein